MQPEGIYPKNIYSLNKDLIVKSIEVGEEGQKILIIDDVMRQPQAMIEFAAATGNFDLHKKSGNYYPGVRLLHRVLQT